MRKTVCAVQFEPSTLLETMSLDTDYRHSPSKKRNKMEYKLY